MTVRPEAIRSTEGNVVKAQGRYRIHAVAELTGVPEATLRAWERRYSVPTPLRTPSGYRLYSHKDVEVVKRMRELCGAGMAPADAARVLGTSPVPEPVETASDPFEATSRRIVEATRRMDPMSIESEVRFAMTLGDAHRIVERVFCPALLEIGRDWERGAITVGHEHLASEIISVATRDLLRLLGPARPVGEVVLACFADEDHTLPLYSAAFRFVEWGYRPQVLGARTPPAGLGAAVKELEPAFVGLSVTISPPPHRALELVSAYADAMGDRPWGVGGAAANEMRPLIEARGGTVMDGSVEDTHDLLGRLLASTRR